jgi:hypothetical protein
MGCCGQRQFVQSGTVSKVAKPSITSVAPSQPALKIGIGEAVGTLHYLGSSAILVRGPLSGQSYTFSSAHPIRRVHPRDMQPLLQTGLFRKANPTDIK